MRQINRHRLAQYGLVTGTLILLAGFAGSSAQAAATDNDFREYIRQQCRTNVDFVSKLENALLCISLFQGNDAVSLSGRDNITVSTGVSQTGNPNGAEGRLDQIQVGGLGGTATVSAGAEDGGFGLLLTRLSGETERVETENENAFDSEQSGYVLGIDYQFSEKLLLGLALGDIEDESTITDNGGSLKTESTSQTLYMTWSPLNSLSFDLYYGNSDSDINGRRNVEITGVNTLSGTASSSYESTQTFSGTSINYDWYLGAWAIGGFVAVDSIETETDGYSEEGMTLVELRFPEQVVESRTSSIGLRASYGAEFEWGALLPNLKMISVEEHENEARNIAISLAASPDDGTVPSFVMSTDRPDRKYTTAGLGVIAAFNNGSQIFLDYEQSSGHEFLETSSLTLGALIAF